MSSKFTDKNFVGAESNVVIKQLKLSANCEKATEVAVVKPQIWWASVEDSDDQDSAPVNIPPKSPNVLLEVDDANVEIQAPTLTNEEEDNANEDKDNTEEDKDNADKDEDNADKDEPEATKPVETAKAQHSESNN